MAMNFTGFDITIIFTSVLAVVLLSIIMPAAGYADKANQTTESELPEFNISSSEWDIAGDFPDEPGTPNSGVLEFDQSLTNPSDVEGRSEIWIDRSDNKDNGTVLEIQNDTFGNANLQIVVIDFRSTGSNPDDRYNITDQNVSETVLHRNTTWSIEFTVDDITNYQQPNMTATVSWEILDNTKGGGGLSALPGIGWLFDSAEYLVLALAYLGDIIFWMVGTVIEVAITAASTLYSAMIYGIDIMQFMTNTYTDIISATSSWASVLVAIPPILLFTEFAKVAMIGISLLPTT